MGTSTVSRGERTTRCPENHDPQYIELALAFIQKALYVTFSQSTASFQILFLFKISLHFPILSQSATTDNFTLTSAVSFLFSVLSHLELFHFVHFSI
jgi:hypothetical protein